LSFSSLSLVERSVVCVDNVSQIFISLDILSWHLSLFSVTSWMDTDSFTVWFSNAL
jgi:hypothetical protein